MAALLWRVCRMMSRSVLRARAAELARPARREGPAKAAGSSPARMAARLTIRATLAPDRADSPTAPWRVTSRKTGPLLMPEASSHLARLVGGHRVGREPLGMPTVVPSPSWSAFDR